MARTSYIRLDDARSVLDQLTYLDLYSANSLTCNNLWVDMSDTLSLFRANQSLFFSLLNDVWLVGKQQIPIASSLI